MLRIAVCAVLAAAVFAAAPVSAGTSKQPKAAAKPACPTKEPFAADGTCDCPKGYSIVLHGSGAGECQRVACTMSGPIKDPRHCDCPDGFEMKKTKKETRCVHKTTGSPSVAPAAATAPKK
jgi:hypothetical protein